MSFKTVGLKIKLYIIAKLIKNYKKILASAGGFIVYVAITFAGPLGGIMTLSDWLLDVYKIFTTSLFSVFIYSILEKENGNGEIKKTILEEKKINPDYHRMRK